MFVRGHVHVGCERTRDNLNFFAQFFNVEFAGWRFAAKIVGLPS